MDDDSVIRESDLIKTDGTIDKLITQLEGLNNSFAAISSNVKKNAEGIASALKSTSGATKEGRKAIDECTAAASRLEKAEQELAFASSDVGKQVAWLKAQTADMNKATVEQKRQIDAVESSYNRIQSELNELIALYKSLSQEERKDAAYGKEVALQIRLKKIELQSLNEAITPHIRQLTELQKAQQKLAYLQSEEGKELLKVKKQISELTSGRKTEKIATDALTQAEQKLAEVESGMKLRLFEVNAELEKSTKYQKAVARENIAQAGSYEQLSATYTRAKLELEKLNLTLPENKEYIEALTKELNSAYAQMRKFQESTGVYSLGVGSYKESFSGLNFAVQQVVRELPAAAVSLNTFFLAISNNIPILVDEIKRSKTAFDAQKEAILKSAKSSEEAAKQIKKLDKPIKTVIKSLFSWQTALVLVLTVLPKYGDKIFEFIGSLFESDNAVKRLAKSLKAVRKEMANTNADYGKSMVTMRRLRDEYKELSTETEKTEWLKKNSDEWKKLNVAMYSVADAERMFIDRTEEVKQAFMLRAKAAAAEKLAEEKYLEMVPHLAKQAEIRKKGVEAYTSIPVPASRLEALKANPNLKYVPTFSFNEPRGDYEMFTAEEQYNADLNYLDRKIEKLNKEADAYYDIYIAANTAADAELGTYDKEEGRGAYGRGKSGGRDIAKYLETMRVKVTKEADEAISKMQISEFAKRRKEAQKNYNESTGDLKNTLSENTRILEGYYKLKTPLTDDQKNTLKVANADIEKTLSDYESVYNKTMRDIALDEQVFYAEQNGKLIQMKLDSVKKGSAEEYKLRKEALENQRKLELLNNKKLDKNERQDEVVINKKYDKQSADIDNEERLSKLKVVNEAIELKLDAVKEGSKEEYDLRKNAIQSQMEMEIAQNSLLAEEEQQKEEDIRKKYNKQLEDLEYEHQMAMIDIQKKAIELRLGNVQTGSEDEYELLLEQIELERDAALKANEQLAKEMQQDAADIRAYYAKMADYAAGRYELSTFRTDQTNKTASTLKPTVKNVVKYGAEGSRKREVYDIVQKILDIEKQIKLAEAGKLNLSEEQLANLKLQLVQLNNQKKTLSGFDGVMHDIADGGIAGGILGALGFSDDAIEAFNTAVDTIIDGINEIIEAEIEAAEKAVELAQERVDAAQSAYDAELEARNNGYANSVETARKELEDERKNEEEKQKLLEEATKKQEAINTIMQTSSLITAAAQIWSSMSGVPIVGPILAGAAIATMFASFAYAKVKASQVAASAKYGEGGLEFLEGGSHASGNDIDLHTKNSEGKNMRAEGGEALAIINKKSTAKYRNELPAIIDSLNSGSFEDTYMKAFVNDPYLTLSVNGSNTNLALLEDEVKRIRQNGEIHYYTRSDGSTVMRYKNLRRIIKNS